MGAGPWAGGRTDCRCRIFSWWPLKWDEGPLSLAAAPAPGPAPPLAPPPPPLPPPLLPPPYLRVCGRIFFPRRQSASALSMSSCTSSAWGDGASGWLSGGIWAPRPAPIPPPTARPSPPPRRSGRSGRRACSGLSPGTQAEAPMGSVAGSAPSGCAARSAAGSSPAPPGGQAAGTRLAMVHGESPRHGGGLTAMGTGKTRGADAGETG